MEEKDEIQQISLAAFEAERERQARTIRRLAIAWAIATIALSVTLLVTITL